MNRGSVREPRRPLVSWNDEGSLAAVRPDYRNGSGAGVSTDNSSDLLVATCATRDAGLPADGARLPARRALRVSRPISAEARAKTESGS